MAWRETPVSSMSNGPSHWVTFPKQSRILSDLEAVYPQARTLHWADASGRPLFDLLETWDAEGPNPGAFAPTPEPSHCSGSPGPWGKPETQDALSRRPEWSAVLLSPAGLRAIIGV